MTDIAFSASCRMFLRLKLRIENSTKICTVINDKVANQTRKTGKKLLEKVKLMSLNNHIFHCEQASRIQDSLKKDE